MTRPFRRTARRHKQTNPADRTAEDEIVILQEILALHSGQLENFHPEQPPSSIRYFLRRASLGQLQGTLVELLVAMRSQACPDPVVFDEHR